MFITLFDSRLPEYAILINSSRSTKAIASQRAIREQAIAETMRSWSVSLDI